MSSERNCPDCGVTLPVDAPRGFCPQCLMGAALPRRFSHESAGTSAHEPAARSVLDTLAATIGPVPRVLLCDTGPGEEPGPIVKPGAAFADGSIRYRIDGEIARGGMGTVLKGRDPDLGREVALKVLRDDYRDDTRMVRRFVEEAQIGGQLQHPGLVPIYELGTLADHRPFFAMKLVKGHTLAQLLVQRSGLLDDQSRFLAIFQAICQTVAYAHARGVIHRDLKPSNVMVGSFGEVQVMDWGLAKVLPRGGVVDDARAGQTSDETLIATARSGPDSDAVLSLVGSIMGTPSYMAPEQARGEVDQIDQRADVFALGSILCELLTGDPVFTGRGSGEIQRSAALGDTAGALERLDSSGADAQLISLAKGCIARAREDRPHDASAVAERITAYLAGVQERMRRAELARIEERDRRRLTTVVAASLLTLSVVGGLGFTYWVQQRQAGAARVALALSEAALLRDQALAYPEDVARWRTALDGLKRAQTALSEAGDDATREQLAKLDDQVQAGSRAADRDHALLEKLIDIRSAWADDPDGSATDLAYSEAFRAAGIDVDGVDPKQAGAGITARPESVRRAVVAALDHWTTVRRQRKPQNDGWPKLIAVARATDPDSVRDALRAALALEDQTRRLERVRPLAERVEAADWSPASLVLLGNTLADAGDVEAGVRVLRQASGFHPTDVWVQYTLGNLLMRMKPPRRDEAITAHAAARAIRPELGHELAHELHRYGLGEQAEAVFRDLVRRRPLAAAHLSCLGALLHDLGRADLAGPVFERAVAVGREAVRLRPNDRTAHLGLGDALLRKGLLDEAIASFRKVIELDPEFALAHKILGDALGKKGQLDDAIACYRKIIELDPKAAAAHVILGAALQGKGQLDDAIACYKTAIELDPKLAHAHNNLGNAMVDKGQWDDAIASYRKVIELEPKSAVVHGNLGKAFRAKGQYDEAIDCFKKGVEVEPKSAAAHSDLGSILCDLKRDYDGAIACFHKAIELEPKSAVAHNNLGNAMQKKGQYDDAIVSYLKAIEFDPKRAEAHLNLGAAFASKGGLEEAIACYRKAIELNPKDVTAHFNLGNALRAKGAYDDAIVSYRKAIELDPKPVPKLVDVYNNLGHVLGAKGRLDEAIDCYQKAVKLDPNYASTHNNLGNALKKKGQSDQAIACFRKAIDIDPSFAVAYINLGGILCDLKRDYDGAIACFGKAIDIDPKFAMAHDNLGVALRNKGELDEAIACFRKAIDIDPKYVVAYINLGAILCDLKRDYDGAITCFGKATLLNPKFAIAHDNLGVALIGKGRLDEAIVSLHKAIDLAPQYAAARNHLTKAQRLAAARDKLSAFQNGSYDPASNEERLVLAEWCQIKQLQRTSARLHAEAFAADPKLAENLEAAHRYNAACFAALAAAGKGADADGLDDQERVRLRKQALDWLHADLALHVKQLEGANPNVRAAVERTMQHWQKDADLAGVRDREALAKLPEAERKEWDAHWAEVQDLIARAGKEAH
jgi:tetratricopeptide (TPR) repeat protein/tRNA A-37 threonylcarbamoyl transferase component Bud32